MPEDQKIVGGIAYSTRPNLNSGTAWSTWDLRDISWGVENGRSVADLADFLCRSEAEAAEKIEAMGLTERRKQHHE